VIPFRGIVTATPHQRKHMADAQWFVVIDGTEAGPYSPGKIKELAEDGQVGPETPVKRTGMKGFVPAKQIRGLLPSSTPNSSAPSPRSQPQPGRSAPRKSPKAMVPLVIGTGSLILIIALIMGVAGAGKHKASTAEPHLDGNAVQSTATSVSDESALAAIGLDVKTSYAAIRVLFPKSDSKEADYIMLGLTEGGSLRWKHILDSAWNDGEKRHFEHAAGAQIVVVEGASLNPGNASVDFTRRSVVPSTGQLFVLTASVNLRNLDCRMTIMNAGELPESTDIGKVEVIPYRGASSVTDWLATQNQQAQQKRDAEIKARDDQAAVVKKRQDDKAKKDDEHQAALSASIAQGNDDRKKTSSLKTAQDSHVAAGSARTRYAAALDQFEKSVLNNAAIYAKSVQLWLGPVSQPQQRNTFWSLVQRQQKEYNSWHLDQDKAGYTTRLKSLQEAIAKMTTDDAASVALGNKSVVEDGDKVDPIDAPVFEFVLPMVGDSDPVIFRNRGKDVRLSELKKK